MINPQHLLLIVSLLSLSLVTAHAQNEPYLVANLNTNELGTDIISIHSKDGNAYLNLRYPGGFLSDHFWTSDGTPSGSRRERLSIQSSPNITEALVVEQIICTTRDGLLLLVTEVYDSFDMVVYKLNTMTGELTLFPQLTSSLSAPNGHGRVRIEEVGAIGDFRFLEIVIQDQELKEMWVTDGTSTGTWKMHSSDFRASGVHALNTFEDISFYAIETELFSTGITSNSRELLLDYQEITNHWVSDGHGVVDDAMGDEMYYFNNKLYFNLYTPGSHSRHLYTYNLSTSSLTDLSQLYELPEAQTVFDEFRYFSRSGNFIYFQYQNLLWGLDLASDEITQVDITPGASVGQLVQFDEESILVSADNQTYALKDGVLDHLVDASLVSNESIELGDSRFLPLLSTSTGKEIWKVKKDLSTAEIFIDAREGSADGYISNLTVTNSGFVFYGVNELGTELWLSDGTAEGTQPFNITNGELSSSISNLVRYKDKLVFRAKTEANPYEPHALYELDYATNRVNKITGIESSGNTFVFNNQLYLYDSGMYQIDDSFQIQETIYSAKENNRFGRVRSVTVLPESFTFISSISSDYPSDIWISNGKMDDTYPITSIASFIELEFYAVSNQSNKIFFRSIDSDGRDAIFEFDIPSGVLSQMPESSEIRALDKYGNNVMLYTNQGYLIYNEECGLFSTEFQNYSSLFFIGDRLFTFDNNDIYEINCGTLDRRYTFNSSERISTTIPSQNAVAVVTQNENSEEWSLWYFDGDRAATQPFKKSSGFIAPSFRTEQDLFTQFGSLSDLFFYSSDGQHWGSNGQLGVEQGLGSAWFRSAFPENFIGLKNRLYFKANDGPEGEELWAVDIDGGFLEIKINDQLAMNGGSIDLGVLSDTTLTMTLDNSGNVPIDISRIVTSGAISPVNNSPVVLAPSMSIDKELELSALEGETVGQVMVSSNSFNYPELSFEITALIVNKERQDIQIDLPDTIRYGVDPIPLTIAGGMTSFPTSYVTSHPEILDVIDGNAVSADVGVSVITARHPGSDQFLPDSVSKVITVIRGLQEISFDIPDTLNVGETYVLEGTSTSGFILGYALSQTDIASIQGRNLTLSGPGEIEIIAYQNGTGLYDRAQPVSRKITVVGTISAIESQVELNIYPNPADQELSIELPNHSIKSLKMIDLSGKICHESRAQSSPATIDVQTLPSGMYILQFETSTGVQATRKVLIQR